MGTVLSGKKEGTIVRQVDVIQMAPLRNVKLYAKLQLSAARGELRISADSSSQPEGLG
jgi:hypothetical protein